MGMPWVLINQTVNLDQLGGEQAIRANLLACGAWIILRTDSAQVNLGDLPPPGFTAGLRRVPSPAQADRRLCPPPTRDLHRHRPGNGHAGRAARHGGLRRCGRVTAGRRRVGGPEGAGGAPRACGARPRSGAGARRSGRGRRARRGPAV